MKTFAVISHNDGAIQTGNCCLFPNKESAYNYMLDEVWETLNSAYANALWKFEPKKGPAEEEEIKKELENIDGNIDQDSVDFEYYGVTYEWKIQECIVPEKTGNADNNIHLNIPADSQPEFFGQLIDCFDDFLQEQDVRLPRSVKELEEGEEDNCNARIYGSDYDDLNSSIKQTIRSWSQEKAEPAKSHNVLVIHELYENGDVEVFELPDDDKKAEEQAKKIFDEDLKTEQKEGSVRVDEKNTWWNKEDSCGQIAWVDNTRATYDVTFTSKIQQ